MSVQIANPGGTAERAEVVGRIGGLVTAAIEMALVPAEDRVEWQAKWDKLCDHARTLHFALLGSYPHGEQLREMIGDRPE